MVQFIYNPLFKITIGRSRRVPFRCPGHEENPLKTLAGPPQVVRSFPDAAMSNDGGRPSQLAGSPYSQHDSKRSLDSPLESSKPSKLSRSMPEGEVGAEEAKDRVEEEREIMSQNPRIQRYLVAVEYIGTRFSGSQKQPNCRTVVGVLEVWARRLDRFFFLDL